MEYNKVESSDEELKPVIVKGIRTKDPLLLFVFLCREWDFNEYCAGYIANFQLFNYSWKQLCHAKDVR